MVVYLRPRDHPDKDVRKALEAICAGSGGWRIVKGGHWGSLRCGGGCCMVPVSGTPANAKNHARFLERESRKHPKPDSDPRSRARRVES